MKKRRYERGYDTSHLDVKIRGKLERFKETNLIACVFEAILTVASIPLLATLFLWGATEYFSVGLPEWLTLPTIILGYIIVAVAIARQQRGIELMVHDASHVAWHRHSRKLNDCLANLLVATPVLSWISSYRKSHLVHHGTYGGKEDPCRRRFEEMGVRAADLSTRWKIALAVLNWLPQYNLAYYKEIGSLSFVRWVCFWLWHSALLIFPATALIITMTPLSVWSAFSLAFLGWVMFWMLPFLGILPIIRSIAECEEHNYDIADSEFETTYTNTGWWHKVLFHPKNDAYHLVHHMFPAIPERVHHRVHQLLMKCDPKYQRSLERTTVLRDE